MLYGPYLSGMSATGTHWIVFSDSVAQKGKGLLYCLRNNILARTQTSYISRFFYLFHGKTGFLVRLS